MSTVTISLAQGTEAGAALRQIANVFTALAENLPDRTATGGGTSVVIDNAPADGAAVGIQVTASPAGASPLYTVRG